MVDSNRELLLKGYKTTLESIKTSNGFNNTVTKVERKMLAIDTPNLSFPVLMLLGAGEVYTDIFGERTQSGFQIKIRGYSRDQANPEVALNSLIRDVLQVLDNKTYNSYHVNYRPIRLDTDEGWLSTEMEGVGMFELTIEQLYQFDRSAP